MISNEHDQPAERPADSGAGPAEGASRYSRQQGLIFAACLLLLAGLGWLDYATGYELGFFIFYSLPVGMVAWHLGRWPGIGVALVASIAWWLADSCGGAKYSSSFYWIWNNLIHFLSFVINAVAIAKIKSELDEVRHLEAELENARRTLRAVAPLLTVCPACGKAHGHPQGGGDVTAPLAAPLPAEIATALCADCAVR